MSTAPALPESPFTVEAAYRHGGGAKPFRRNFNHDDLGGAHARYRLLQTEPSVRHLRITVAIAEWHRSGD